MAPAAPSRPPARARDPWVLPAILLAGAAVRLAYLGELRTTPDTYAPGFDAAFHAHWARALWTGDWTPPQFFPDPAIERTAFFRPPGYPYFLALVHGLTGGEPLALRAVQQGLGLANAWLGHRLASGWHGIGAGRAVAAGLALGWPLVYFEGELLAPVLTITLVLLLLLTLQRWATAGGRALAAGAGLLLGGLALVLPNALALAPPLWLYALWRQRQARPHGHRGGAALWLPLGAALAIAPATLRNLAVAGEFVPISANAGVNLYIGNHPTADGYTARIPDLQALAPRRGWTCFDQPAIARGVERAAGRPLGASEVSAWFAAKALAYVREEPLAALRLTLRKALLFLGPDEVANDRQLELVRQQSSVLRWLPGFPWLLAFGALGALWSARQLRGQPPGPHRDAWLLPLLAAAALLASYLPFFVAGRYRAPLWPLLLLLGAPLAAATAAALGRGERRRALAAVAAFALAGALLHLRWTDYRPNPADHHFQTGDAWRMRGEPARAAAAYRAALALAPDEPVVHNNLGAVLLQLGQGEAALAHLQRAIALAPDYAEAHYNRGEVLAAAGRDDAACDAFAAALRADPDALPPRRKLGALRLRQGRAADALPHLARAAAAPGADPAVRLLHALACLDTGDAAGARTLLQNLLRDAPGHADAAVTLAELEWQRGDRAAARRLVQQALAADPRHAGALALHQQWH